MNHVSPGFFALERLEQRTLLSFQIYTTPNPVGDIQSEVLGRDGSLYFAEVNSWRIGRILPNKRIVEYGAPYGLSVNTPLVAAKDGSIYFVYDSGNADLFYSGNDGIGRMDAKGRFTTIPTENLATAMGAATDGSIWFSTLDGFSQITSNGVVNFGGGDHLSRVTKIIPGPGGSIYYAAVTSMTDFTQNLFSVHHLTIVDGKPQDDTLFSGKTYLYFPLYSGITFTANDLAMGSDGNLWFYDGRATIWAEDPNTGRMVGSINQAAFSHPNPVLSIDPFPERLFNLGSLVSGPDGKLWFVDNREGRIWTFTFGGKVSSYSLDNVTASNHAVHPYAIVPGRSNTLWITDEDDSRIYNLNLARTAPSNVSTAGRYVGFSNNSVDYTPFTLQVAPRASGPWTDYGSVQHADSGFVLTRPVTDLLGTSRYVRIFSDGYYSRVARFQ
jgi:streptogramin lyase